MTNFRCFYLGKVQYRNALKLQETLIQWNNGFCKDVTPKPTILLLEHFPVYTIGLRSSVYKQSEENYLSRLGADFVRTNRGGRINQRWFTVGRGVHLLSPGKTSFRDNSSPWYNRLITFHGPGQLVAYPILNLKKHGMGVRRYVECLEEVIIQLCAMHNINAERSPHTGVWVGSNKVCAMGINVQRHVCSHGLALNCNTDMKWFSHIVPCGIHGKGVTSLSELTNETVSVEDTLPRFVKCFSNVFRVDLEKTVFLEENLSDKQRLQKIIAEHLENVDDLSVSDEYCERTRDR